MISDNDSSLEEAFLDELLSKYPDMFNYSDLDFPDTHFSKELLEETLVPLDEPYVIQNSFVDSSSDIPTDPKEWVILDQTSKRHRPPRLFEFLILLLQKTHYSTYASYTDKSRGIFHVHEPEKVADLWQQVKNRQSNQKMTYDKLARAVRWYYKLNIMQKTNARYTFQFSSKTLENRIIDENNNIITDYSMSSSDQEYISGM